uniref:TRASH domain-containing protein n=1 Tax=Astatotilapia calliptera TaxID=8154 RepID=A0A3P8QSP5_ASTCA
DSGTMKELCSDTCLSSVTSKMKKAATKPPPKEGPSSQLCSDSCFMSYRKVNNLRLSLCDMCDAVCYNKCLVVKLEDGSKLFCTKSCVSAFKIQAVNSSGTGRMLCSASVFSCFPRLNLPFSSAASLNCDHCGKTAVPTCHLAMSDASIRNFCTLKCGMDFRVMYLIYANKTKPSIPTQKHLKAPKAGVPDQSQRDFLHPPPKLLCAQCQSIVLTTPKVIQRKEKIYFACSVACFQEFKRVNSITATCEYCKNERIIKDVKRVGGKDCCFCSDACKTLFCQELKGKWGKHCRSCSYCQSISKSLVTTPGEDTDIEFCSEACCSKYKMLLIHVAKCDTCSNKGKLKQSLPLLGEVKYFCGMKCLLHFCSNKVQMLDGGMHICCTIFSELTVFGVYSIFSFLLLEDRCDPKVVVLPVPVPVYVPVPMNMYSQYTPQPVGLPLLVTHALTLKADLLRCSVAELSDCLLCFIREVKQSDGEPYSPGRLFYLCLSIQLFLVQNGRLENIFSDLIYDRFSTELTKILKPSVTGCVLSCVEEQFLWDCKQLGAYSPTVLLNTLLFFFCKYFGFTTVEQHRRLSFANITLCTKTSKSNTKTTFLRFHPPTYTYDVPAKKVKKNESEEDLLEMMENQENPLRCPVRLYEFYLSKCPASLRQRSDLFYLQPDRSCLPSSPLWFSPAPLNDSSVEATIIRILAVRGLQGGEREGACMAP